MMCVSCRFSSTPCNVCRPATFASPLVVVRLRALVVELGNAFTSEFPRRAMTSLRFVSNFLLWLILAVRSLW